MAEDITNPYAPPAEVTDSPWSMPPDTEFLFNDDVIAAVGTLTLPKVCVLTGRRAQLIEQTTTLRATPFRQVFVPVLAVSALIGGFMGFRWAFGMPPFSVAPWNLVVIAVLVVSVLGVILTRHTLKITWYIADTELKPLESRQRSAGLLFIGLSVVVFVVWLIGGGSLGLEFIALIGIMLISSFFSTRVLGSSGCYKKLVVARGFKPPFVQELRRMIDAHEETCQNASESEATASVKQKTPNHGVLPS